MSCLIEQPNSLTHEEDKHNTTQKIKTLNNVDSTKYFGLAQVLMKHQQFWPLVRIVNRKKKYKNISYMLGYSCGSLQTSNTEMNSLYYGAPVTVTQILIFSSNKFV